MKQFTVYLLAIACALPFTNCTKVVYSHSSYLSQFRTKDQVIGRFGLPNNKQEAEGVTEWYYDFGRVSTGIGMAQTNSNATVNGYGNSVSGYGSRNTLGITQYSTTDRYLKFIFNSDGQVTSWNSQGVDFTKRKSKTALNIILIVVGVAACVAIGAALGSD